MRTFAGPREHAVRPLNSGTPHGYRIRAGFAGDRGTGSRLEARVCNITFTRH